MVNNDPADWVPGFMLIHRERFDPHDWPAADGSKYEAMVEDWAAALMAERVTEPEARRASRRLIAKPPKYRRDHLPAILAAVKRMRIDGDARAATTEEAERQSAGCERCGGAGTTWVYDPAPSYQARRPRAVAAHCVCALGRHYRAALDTKTHRETLRGFVDLADVIAARSVNGIVYQIEPPEAHGTEASRLEYIGEPKGIEIL